MLKKIITLVIFIAFNVALFSGVYLSKHQFGAHLQTVKAGTPVPDFSWQDTEDKTHSIKELAGRPVIIHFWASWCGPCRLEFPDLLEAAKKAGPDVMFLTVSGDDTKADMEQFLKGVLDDTAGAKDLTNMLYAFDPQKKIAFDTFQTSAYPETIIVDRNGFMTQKLVGAVRWRGDEINAYLKSLSVLQATPAK